MRSHPTKKDAVPPSAGANPRAGTEAGSARIIPGVMSRRGFLRAGAQTAAGLSLAGFAARTAAAGPIEGEATIAELQAAMSGGPAQQRLTARALVEMFLERIETMDRRGPKVNSVIEVNPDALAIAAELDRERQAGRVRGPLHGIPILIKDNIDTADRMLTTAGSLALVGAAPAQDATVAKKLRDAGAILLGKANLSEWANFRGFNSSSGWSARGGQTRNPYALDRSPCGSSSGSAAAVAANFCAAALGTETDGSITCPSSACGVVGIKPTVGLVSRAGVVPISHSQDTVGPHGRTVADAAAVLGALTGVDPRDPATQASEGKFFTDYTRFLDANGLRGTRIGVPRKPYYGYNAKLDALAEAALKVMRDAGATVVDPAEIATAETIATDPAEFDVLLYEFKADLNAYLATRSGVPVRTLEEAIAFNKEHAAEEMPFFGQELFELAQEKGPLTDPAYVAAREKSLRLSRTEGLDAVLDANQLDALVAPMLGPVWLIDLIFGDRFDPRSVGSAAPSSPAAMAGYPLIVVPMGYVSGLPVGLLFMGRAFSEPTLIRLAYAYEQASKRRLAPQFLPTAPVGA